VDAPVTGSKIGAENAHCCSLWADQRDSGALDPLFMALGKKVIRVERPARREREDRNEPDDRVIFEGLPRRWR